MRKSLLLLPFLCLLTSTAVAQLIVVPIAKSVQVKKKYLTGSRADLTPLKLPFWDDFSTGSLYPNDTLWQNGSTVSLNYGIGVNPPSLGTVTLDGLDSLGKPYDVNNALAKGYADSLESRAIHLDLVPVPDRATVYLSFYYQFMGNGEPPDPGDHLDLDFMNDQGIWENIKLIAPDTTLKPNEFTSMIVAITDDRFFHDTFQFRFRSFGRLSGPYDTWNLDYVYLNSGRNASDTSFPDRTIASPLTSMFTSYWSIPVKHFRNGPNTNQTFPSFSIYNLRVGNIQPLNYSYHADLISYKAGVVDSIGIALQDSTSAGNGLAGLERRTVTVESRIPAALFDPLADSFKIKLKVGLKTKDNVLPSANGDYDSAKYKPIDFRVNDTTRATFTLAKYYAYDDGSAEYGIGLNQPGAQLAYRFDMKTPDVDTVVAVDLYFPRFGDQSNQIILFRILSDLTDDPQSVLYEENIGVERSELNKFIRHKLTRNTVLVQGSFFVGWKQSTAVPIPIGWDKNTDSGDRIFYNTNGSWEANLLEKGSMMIHPVFGEGGIVTGLHPEPVATDAYPNPTTGIFYVTGDPDLVVLLDLAGKAVPTTNEVVDHQTRITITYPTPGLYVLKAYFDHQIITKKIMVRQ